MREDALLKRYELFVTTAIIAAHAQNHEKGFRQRDVRFLIELFSNWVEFTLGSISSMLSNTQISRYVEQMVQEGHAKRTRSKKWPHYRLTRLGLLELLTRTVEKLHWQHPEHFFFLYYFISNYKPIITALIQAEGSQYPRALQIEIAALLDSQELIKRQISAAQQELLKISSRIEDAHQVSKLTVQLKSKGINFEEIAKEIERRYPYELNSQKPLTSLLSELPLNMAKWEMETGTLRRAEQIWTPNRDLLITYIKQLTKLRLSKSS